MSKYHDVQSIVFKANEMVLTVDDVTYRFNLEDVSSRLFQASQTERERFEISPSGYGIHWPQIDEDLSVDALLGITHAPLFVLKKAA